MPTLLFGAHCARRSATLSAAVVAGCISVAGIDLFGTAAPAAAQQGFGNFFGYQQKPAKRRSVRRRRPAQESQTADAETKQKKAEENAPSQPVYAIVSLGDQHITVYDSNGRIARSRVSSGTRGHATPRGVFSVIGRSRYHRSNIYSGAPMPWMQRITWSGIAMHAGVVPGYPASHGCIRLPYSFAPQLWKMTKMGARVVVAPRDTEPFPITHAFLPAPKMYDSPTAAIAQEASANLPVPKPGTELASASPVEPVALTTSAAAEPPAPPKKLDPIAYAKALKIRAKVDKAAADKAAKEALEAAQTAGAEARQAVEDVAKAEADLKAAEAKVAMLENPPLPKPDDEETFVATASETSEATTTAKTAAQSELIRARAALDEAHRREATKTPAAFKAVETWKAAVAASEAAAQTLSEAERRVEPVSVFISKKEGRVFIRQDWKEVYEAPVTIRDPDRPLGTHVYIAVASEPDASAMRWSAITVPESDKSTGGKKAKKASKSAADDIELPRQKPSGNGPAAEALDRIELPEDARQRIADLLWTGASLIVSDHGRSYEMGEYTDFIVLTR